MSDTPSTAERLARVRHLFAERVRDLHAVCAHEAGHAIVAVLLGLDFTEAAVEGNSAAGFVGMVSMGSSGPGRDEDTLGWARQRAMLLYSGSVAESLFVPGAVGRNTQLMENLHELRGAGVRAIDGHDDLLLVERDRSRCSWLLSRV